MKRPIEIEFIGAGRSLRDAFDSMIRQIEDAVGRTPRF